MSARRKPPQASFADLLAPLAAKVQPPLGVILGSPREAAELVAAASVADSVAWQLDLFQANRLREELAARRVVAEIARLPDLWDLPRPLQTLLYPVPQRGERSLKFDLIEQAYHTLAPQGHLIVLSPYEHDNVLSTALKKVFGSVHVPPKLGNAVLWCRREDDRPRRRHEMTYQVRVDEAKSLRFVSRPGTFSYGRFDHGSRALLEVAEIKAGNRVVDLGCGCGANGILAAQRTGPGGFIAFVDSNVRGLALVELNAREQCPAPYQTFATADVSGVPEGSFDVVLANPPYYAQSSIAQLFIERGKALLKKGGQFYLVTKMLDEVAALMMETFGDTDVFEGRGYHIFQAVR